METTERLIRVTPRELQAVFDRLEAEHATRLAIIGQNRRLSVDANVWPEIYQLSEPWLALADRVIRLRQLDRVILWGLDLGDDGAKAIAEHLRQLTSLDISDNSIGEAGSRAIAEHLTQLTWLDVGSNKIGEAGARAIAEHLTQLTSLVVARNKIGDAGARAIAEHLTQLQSLWLGDNQVGQATIGLLGQRLRSLTRLSIAENNDVRDIGPLAGLPTLRHLNVSKTSVSDLGPFADRIADGWPVRWESWGGGDGLIVEDCPLVRPTVEIAQQGPEAVRNYFRELAAQGEDYLYEAKVLILGEGGAGKTSLLRRLYQPPRELPKEDETTRGIDIHRHDFVGNHGQPFRLNVWASAGSRSITPRTSSS